MAFYQPTLDVLWKALGEDRLVYGSNWPVSDHFAPYATVFKLVNEYLTTQGANARKKVLGLNSIAAYKLKRG